MAKNCVYTKPGSFFLEGKEYRKGDPLVISEALYEMYQDRLQVIEEVPLGDEDKEPETAHESPKKVSKKGSKP